MVGHEERATLAGDPVEALPRHPVPRAVQRPVGAAGKLAQVGRAAPLVDVARSGVVDRLGLLVGHGREVQQHDLGRGGPRLVRFVARVLVGHRGARLPRPWDGASKRRGAAGTTQVNVTEPVGGQDGIVLTKDGRLVATSNSESEPRLVAFMSNDNWMSAQRVSTAILNGQATTAAIVGDEIWAVHPHFADAEAPTIERGVFQ